MAVEDVEDAEDVEEGDSAREADPVCLGAQTLHAEIHAWLDTVAPGDPGPAPLDSEHSAAADADDAAGFLSAWSQTNAFYNRIGKENAAHKGDGAFGCVLAYGALFGFACVACGVPQNDPLG